MISPGNMTPSDILSSFGVGELIFFNGQKIINCKTLLFSFLKRTAGTLYSEEQVQQKPHIQFCPKDYKYEINTRVYLGFAVKI